MGYLAVFGVTLGRYNKGSKFAIGIPVTGRRRPEHSKMVGMMVNMIPICFDLSTATVTFRDLLKEVRSRTLNAYANQDIPFSRVVSELKPPRVNGRNPVFQTLFTLFECRSRGDAGAKWYGSRCEPVRFSGKGTRFDVELSLNVKPRAAEGNFAFNAGLVSPRMAALMAADLERLSKELFASPETTVEEAWQMLDKGGWWEARTEEAGT
jgi:non-ribosomal peptide synthetase component F